MQSLKNADTARAMRIAQISDSHISLDAPARLDDLKRCVAQINDLALPADVAVHTGDVSHSGSLQECELARGALEELTCPWFVIPGNKDQRQSLVDVFFDGRAPATHFAFVQYAIDLFPVRLILIDTCSDHSNKGEFCDERLSDLDAMLSEDPAKPAALFMHHPPFHIPVGPDALQFVIRDEATAVCNLLSRHANVCGVYCGHVHRTVESSIGSVPATVMTASALDRRFGETDTPTLQTPLFRIHDIDPGTVLHSQER